MNDKCLSLPYCWYGRVVHCVALFAVQFREPPMTERCTVRLGNNSTQIFHGLCFWSLPTCNKHWRVVKFHILSFQTDGRSYYAIQYSDTVNYTVQNSTVQYRQHDKVTSLHEDTRTRRGTQ
jgi:hypothetical protein